jgi:hypothetical protein
MVLLATSQPFSEEIVFYEITMNQKKSEQQRKRICTNRIKQFYINNQCQPSMFFAMSFHFTTVFDITRQNYNFLLDDRFKIILHNQYISIKFI